MNSKQMKSRLPRRRMIWWTLGLVFLGVCVWGATLLSGSRTRYNLIVITVDTCRADHLSCYGFPRNTTPRLDELARESLLFTRAYSPVPLTLPAHCSLFTGTLPQYHGVRDNLDYRLGADNITLAELLRDAGYETAAIVGSFILDSQFALDRGFSQYDDDFSSSDDGNVFNEQKGAETSRLATEWLAQREGSPFFLFLHYYDPHTLYDPPEPFASRFADDLYAGEIAYTDHCLGEVLDTLRDLDLYDTSLIIVTGDHGEMLQEHGELEHGFFVYESAVRVPLLLKLPHEKQSRQVADPVGLIDIVPTVCHLLDLSPPEALPGKNLLATDSSADSERFVYCESLIPTKYGGASLQAVVGPQWKYIHTARPELYDLTRDPGETTNRWSDHPELAGRLHEQLPLILGETKRETAASSQVELDEQARRRLASLGYVSGSVATENTPLTDQEDPKDLISLHVAMAQVEEHLLLAQYEDARDECESILAERPHCFKARYQLGLIAMAQGQFEAALVAFREAQVMEPDDYYSFAKYGIALNSLGRFDEAVSALREAVRINPHKPEGLNNLAIALGQTGQLAEAAITFEKVLAIDPSIKATYYNLGMTYLKLNRHEDAVRVFELSLVIDPEQIPVHNQLARIHYGQQDFVRARQHLEQSLRLDPDQPQTVFSLAGVLLGIGLQAEAVDTASAALRLARRFQEDGLAERIERFLQLQDGGDTPH
ncbi:MAG: sulfatase-like hydrolase/transferase [bacterium]